MNGDIVRAVLDGARVTITPDRWPLKGPVKEVRVSVTAQTWNGVRTINRKIELGPGNTDVLDAVISEAIKDMAEAIDGPK